MANPFVRIAAGVANKATSAYNNAKNQANGQESQKQSVGGAVASAALFSPLAWKIALILALLVIVIIIIAGFFNTVQNSLTNISGATCTDTSTQIEFLRELEDEGIPLTDTERETLTTQPENPCGGVGYTGQTYPPTIGFKTSPYGDREPPCPGCSSFHRGIDIADQCGAPVFAFAGGTVTVAIPGSDELSSRNNPQPPMGIIIIQHTEEFATAYYHTRASQTFVRVGDVVNAGDLIADQWSNGTSTGCHLHFEARLNGARIDPEPILLSYGYDYTLGYTLDTLPPVPDPKEVGSIETKKYPTGSAQAIAQNLMSSKGWTQAEFEDCLVPLWRKASGWSVNYSNASSGAYGIPAARPKDALASAGDDWETNAETQVKWGLNYIDTKYGNPCAAWAHMESKNWY